MNRWLRRGLWVGGFSLALFVLATPAKASANCGWSYTSWTQQVGQGSCGWQQGGYKNRNFYFSGQISLPSEVQRIEFYNGSIDDIGEMTANGVMVYHDPSGCGNPGYPTVTLTSPGSVVNMYLHTVDSCGGSTGGNIQFTFYRTVAPPPVVVGCSASPNPVPLGQATTLTGYGADPGAGVITQFQWDFGDGSTASRAERAERLGDANQTGQRERGEFRSPLDRWLAPSAQAGGGGGGPAGPPMTLAASPATVTFGQSATISWSVESTYTNTFTLVASNSFGTVSQTLTVPVLAEGPITRTFVEKKFEEEKPSVRATDRWWPPQIAHAGGGGGLEPGPLTIDRYDYTYQGSQSATVPNGAQITLSWEISGLPTTLTINGQPQSHGIGTQSTTVQVGVVTVTSNFSSGAMPLSGSVAVTPSYLNQYTVTATDPTGTRSQSISINVLQPPVTHTYLAPGTYTVTLRAISSSGNSGTGQCLVTVLAPPAPTVDLKVQGPSGSPTDGPLTVPYQSPVTLSWTSSGSTSCLAGGAWSGSKATSSSEQTSPLVNGTYTYTLTCSFGSLTSSADSVVVLVDLPPAAQVDLKASKPGGSASDSLTVDFNNPAILSWTTTNASNCTATGAWSGSKLLQNTTGESTGNLTSPKTYTLTCLNPINLATTDNVTIQVGPRPGDFPQSLFEGAFIGPSLTITRAGELKIHFDSRIQANPPPGFVNLLPPATEEGS